METNEPNIEQDKDKFWPHHSRKGRVMGGIVLIAVGTVLFLNQISFLQLPSWVFTWEMLLITLGVYIGAKHAFRHPGWIIPVAIGTVFILDDINPDLSIGTYVWPILIITAGVFMIFSPKRKFGKQRWEKWKKKIEEERIYSNENDYLDCVSVFGGIKKNIFTKDFKGGEIVSFFGGAEVNLTQADINGQVILDISAVFGGMRLIVPPHWEIKSELVSVMGGIDDKRPVFKDNTPDPNKVLILKGNVVFGGIDIKSY